MKYLQKCAAVWLKEKPEIWEEPVLCEYRKRAIWYSGLNGKRNFAWIGLPDGASPEHKVPGIVLIHGGGGTAFASWADLWTKRGYAVIAMDTCGAFPDVRNQYNNWPRHSYSGPEGWGAWGQETLPPEDQWFPHAVASIIKATTILTDLPEVDAGRIGMTGISWGSVLSLIAAGLDPRIKALSAVYGCGYLDEMQITWKENFDKLTQVQHEWWKNEWDPSNFLDLIRCPVQWYAGTNDLAFDLPSWKKSTDRVPGDFCMKVRWTHSHGLAGEGPREIEAFMEEFLRNGKKRIRLTDAACDGRTLSAAVTGGRILGAQLQVTVDGRSWRECEWLTLNAEVRDGRIVAVLPENWRAAYLSVMSEDLLYSSSSPVIR